MAQKLLIKVKVTACDEVAEGVRRFVLAPLLRPALPSFTPGAHIIVQLPNGMRRPYSLCSDPADHSAYEIAVLREPEGLGGSAYLHERIGVGDTLHVTYPDTTLALASGEGHHLLIAGGIGVTPILSLVRSLVQAKQSFHVHLCFKSPAHAPYLDVIERLAGAERVSTYFGGRTRLDVAALLAEPRAGGHVYCCGPARMLAAVEEAAVHWPAGTVHVEKFQALDRKAARQGVAFDVLIPSSGTVLHVPEDRSLLQVLRQAGHPVDYACEAGACGTCRVRYIAGEPVHRDGCLNPDARTDTMISCVSRARTRLTLDL
jgi:ferredoxin-NADP reductase